MGTKRLTWSERRELRRLRKWLRRADGADGAEVQRVAARIVELSGPSRDYYNPAGL